MTSKASLTFDHAIKDAKDLLSHFDALNAHPPPPEIEVLKRASLVMALAALETYFEDRLIEAVNERCELSTDSGLARFFKVSLDQDLKSFHTPNTERVRALFRKYLGIDITDAWAWNNVTPAEARSELNIIAKKRGDIAHRSGRPSLAPTPQKHAVTRDSLRKHIHFLCELVRATEGRLATLP